MVPGGIFGQSKRAAGYGKLLNDSYERRIAQERAQQKAMLERVAASRPKPQPRRMDVKPYTPTTVERIRSGVRDFGNALGANGDQWSRAIDYLPVVGDGVSLAQAQDDYSRGNYLGAAGNGALGAIGLVPGGGDAAAGVFKAAMGASAKSRILPSYARLNRPVPPSAEQMRQLSSVQEVPLGQARRGQETMHWKEYEAGQRVGPLLDEYADMPVAGLMKNGEYIIFDGNHRTVMALEEGKDKLPMYVIPVDRYDPANAGVAPQPIRQDDLDELMRFLSE